MQIHAPPAGGSRGPGEQKDGVSSEDEGVDALLLTCPPFQLLLLHIHEDKPSFYGALKGQTDVPQRFSPICTSFCALFFLETDALVPLR